MNGIDLGNGSSALQSAQLGIQRGVTGLTRDAQTIAQAAKNPDSPDAVTEALVDAKQQRLQVELAARAMSITDQTLGTLLDIHA